MTESELDGEVRALGRRLGLGPRSIARRANDRAMAVAMRDPELRAALFRLVDVAPACANAREIAEHLAAFTGGTASAAEAASARAAATPVLRSATGALAGVAVNRIAKRFIVGATPVSAAPVLRRLWESGTAVSIDLLGEATVTPAEGQAYADRCEDALRTLAEDVARWPARPLLEHDAGGRLPRVNLSVKLTALTPLVRPEAPERGIEDARRHLRGLLRTARDVGAHLHVDMESMASHELILTLVLDLLAEAEFADGPSAGLVLQAYLRQAEEVLDRLLDWAHATPRAHPLTIRLVKGAYWDHEVIESAQHGWPVPVWTEKRESDRCFERVTRRLIDAYPVVRPAIASHNLRSLAHAIVYADRAGLAARDLELQVLHGLGDDLQDALAREGRRCRTYCPVGDLVAGMAYLVRRLLENSSNDSFIARRATGPELDQLLVRP